MSGEPAWLVGSRTAIHANVYTLPGRSNHFLD